MKKGDVLYMVDVQKGKILTRKIMYCIHQEGMEKKFDLIRIQGFTWQIHAGSFRLNPKPEDYWMSNTKDSRKQCYLVFTEEHLAKAALINYVLPKMIEEQQLEADHLIAEYNQKIAKVQEIEKIIKKLTS